VRSLRRARPDLEVGPGERLLAWASTTDGEVVGGTREAAYVGGVRVPWEQVEAADWDRDTAVLQVAEVGHWGEPRVEHAVTIEEPGRFLELLRERVTASIVLQRHVAVTGRRGVRVIARRAPSGGPLLWIFEYDEGVDPDDPEVQQVADSALAAARDEVGSA
jgi:hypothetical protein